MPGKKKLGRGRKAEIERALKSLEPGEALKPPVLVQVERGTPDSLYDVYVERNRQDVVWWAPDAVELKISFVGEPSLNSVMNSQPKSNCKTLPSSAHTRALTVGKRGGKVIKYVMEITYPHETEPVRIDPFVIIQP